MHKRTCAILFLLNAILAPAVSAQSYIISTIAGTDTLRDGGPATASLLRHPEGVALDAAGNVYIADSWGNRVRKVTPVGMITTVAGTGRAGYSGDGDLATLAQLDGPTSVAVDKNGNLYIADYNNNRIRRVVLSTGIITTIAGADDFRASGDGGPAAAAQLDPMNLALDQAGNIYIADFSNCRIRKITVSTGVINTIAGNGIEGYGGDNATATLSELDGPDAVAVDAVGNVYIADEYNSVVRKVATDGSITTIAGTGAYYDSGDNGPATKAGVVYPSAVAVDSAGTQLFIATGAAEIRIVYLDTGTIKTFAGTGLDSTTRTAVSKSRSISSSTMPRSQSWLLSVCSSVLSCRKTIAKPGSSNWGSRRLSMFGLIRSK